MLPNNKHTPLDVPLTIFYLPIDFRNRYCSNLPKASTRWFGQSFILYYEMNDENGQSSYSYSFGQILMSDVYLNVVLYHVSVLLAVLIFILNDNNASNFRAGLQGGI